MEDLNAARDQTLIGGALARLSPSHRAVLRRSYYLGWTTAQIADDTVKSTLHHAMRALRLTLQEMGVAGFDRNGR